MVILKSADILSLPEFEKIRKVKGQEILRLKQMRRLSVGPDVTFYFENIQTVWWQIQEMLRIEKGGTTQIADELLAYNPIIPVKIKESYEISATMMVEIDDPVRRQVVLKQLFGIDSQVNFFWGNTLIKASAIDNTTERNREFDRKTSSVHFLKWLLPINQVTEFLTTDVYLAITNPHYTFKEMLPLTLKDSLESDFKSLR